MPYYVCKGAKLKCSMGSDQSDLEVVHLEKPVRVCGKFKASIMDHKPLMNIKPFGQCKSLANPVVASATAANYGRLQEMPCIPNTQSPWVNGKMNVFVKGNPALLDCSKCMCLWAGVIEITDPGQKLMSCGSSGLGSQDMGATVGAQNVAATPGNGLALQGAGIGLAAVAGNAVSLGTASQASQGMEAVAGAQAASTQKTLIREVTGAADVYSRQYIEYKVVNYNKDQNEVSDADRNRVRWAVKVDGKITVLEDKKGEKIVLEIPDHYAGKEITVMACLDGFNENVSQKTKVGPLSQKTLIRVAEGAEKASPGHKAEYKVTRYNKDYVSDEFRNSVKWAMKVDGMQKELGKGEKITVEISKEWSGKEIILMPYLNEATEKVAVRTQVGKVTEMYWSYGEGYNRLSTKSLYYEDLNFHVKTENYNDGDTISITLKRDDGKPLFGTTHTLDLNGTVYNNELIFKEVFGKYTLNV